MFKSKYPHIHLMKETLQMYQMYLTSVLGEDVQLSMVDLSIKKGRTKLVSFTSKGTELNLDKVTINKTQLKQMEDLKRFIDPMVKSYIKRVEK